MNVYLGYNFSGSLVVTWWKQHLRDTRVKCQHTHGSGGAKINANTGSHESSHSTWKMTCRALSEGNIPRGATLSGFPPSGCAPVPLDQKHHRWEQSSVQIWGLCSTNQEADPATHSDSHRGKAKRPSRSRQSLVTIVTPTPSQGHKGTSLWTTSPTTEQTPEQEELGSAACRTETTNTEHCTR